MGPTVPSYQPQQQQQQPTRVDPAIEKAKQDELRRQQMERGRGATLIVGKAATGGELLPSGPGGAAQLGA